MKAFHSLPALECLHRCITGQGADQIHDLRQDAGQKEVSSNVGATLLDGRAACSEGKGLLRYRFLLNHEMTQHANKLAQLFHVGNPQVAGSLEYGVKNSDISFLQLRDLFPKEQQIPRIPDCTAARGTRRGLKVSSSAPLGLLQLHGHGSVLTPLLFHVLRLVSPSRCSLALLAFFLDDVIRGFWAHELGAFGFTLQSKYKHAPYSS